MSTCPQCGAETTETTETPGDAATCAGCGHVRVADEQVEADATDATDATADTAADTEAAPEAESEHGPGSSPQEPTQPVETAPRRRGRLVAAIAAGAAIVGVVVGGVAGVAVEHSRDAGGDSTAAGAKLSLPTTISGGFKRSSTVDSEIASSVSSARKTLGAGTDMALYTKGKTEVLVEATRLPGQAILNAGMTYAKVGPAVCASESGSSGSEAICTRTGDALTVQVTASDNATASKYADEVYTTLS